jgi:SAM-dependent methyltransferase
VTERPQLYEAEGLAVESYDSFQSERQDSPIAGDCSFYLELAQAAGGAVLELGAGTGRVVWSLATAGIEVVGLDLSRSMLALAEAKRANQPPETGMRASFVEGSMESFDLGRSFALIICPFRAFQRMLSPEAQRRTLDCVRRHLQPGGHLALHLFDPRLNLLQPDIPPPEERRETVLPSSGNRVKFEIVQRRNDPLHQVMEEVWQFHELAADGAELRREQLTLTLRWTYRWEMRHLLELCGFEVVAEYSDFSKSPPAYGKEQIWVARRP